MALRFPRGVFAALLPGIQQNLGLTAFLPRLFAPRLPVGLSVALFTQGLFFALACQLGVVELLLRGLSFTGFAGGVKRIVAAVALQAGRRQLDNTTEAVE